MKRFGIGAAIFLIVFAGAAEAKVWKVDYPASRLSFSGTQTGQAFTGSFGIWQVRLEGDLALLEQAKIDVTIDMASARTGDAQRDQALPGADWFDVKKYPQATFHVIKVAEAAGSKNAPDARNFMVTAELTIKGVKKEVVMPFTLTQEKTGMHAKGVLTVNRSDFNVGTGEWLSDAYVGKPVTISVDIRGN